MNSIAGAIIDLLSLSIGAVPWILIGMCKIELCTSKNFIRFVSSIGSKKRIWIGMNAKRYCDAVNYTVYLCVFVAIVIVLVTVSIYKTKAPKKVRIAGADGKCFDRSEILFYPNFSEDGVEIVLYDSDEPVFYKYSDVKECAIIGDDGKEFSLFGIAS